MYTSKKLTTKFHESWGQRFKCAAVASKRYSEYVTAGLMDLRMTGITLLLFGIIFEMEHNLIIF